MVARVQQGMERRAADVSQPAASLGSAPRRSLSRADALALQRSAGNHATTLVVQRAIVAVDGDGDTDAQQRATVACLWNLQHKKSSKTFDDGGARGKVAGPATLAKLPANLSTLLASDSESIYVLAHGSRYSASIGGMAPEQMARWLKSKFSGRNFTGKIKLVSCHSGADRTHQQPGDAQAGAYNFDQSYAQALAVALAPSDGDTFRPTSVLGVVGIGWVDETTGSILAINKEKYGQVMSKMSTNSDVKGIASGKKPNPFTEQADPVKRGLELRAEFGEPVQVSVKKNPDYLESTDTAAFHVGKGRWGKRMFAVGTGQEQLPA
jgi:hypothetical protein